MARIYQPKNINIKILGVGGMGSNCLGRLAGLEGRGIERVAVGLGDKAMERLPIGKKIRLEPRERLFSEEMFDREEAKRITKRSVAEIGKAIEGADMVFIVGALGRDINGVTVARVGQQAKKQGILSFAVLTKPFLFEGRGPNRRAEKYLASLPAVIDSLLVISNEALLKSDLTAQEALTMSDQSVDQSINTLLDMINRVGEINVDFNDFRSTAENAGKIFINSAIGPREQLEETLARVAEAGYYDAELKEAGKLLYVIKTDENYLLEEMNRIGDFFAKRLGEQGRIIFGVMVDNEYKGKIGLTVLAGELAGTGKRLETSYESPPARNERKPAKPMFEPAKPAPEEAGEEEYDTPAIFRRGKKDRPETEEDKDIEGAERPLEKDDGDLNVPTFIRRKLGRE